MDRRGKAMESGAWALRPSAPSQRQMIHRAGTHPHRIWGQAVFFVCGLLSSSIEITACLCDIWVDHSAGSARLGVKAIIESDSSPKMVAEVRQMFPARSRGRVQGKTIGFDHHVKPRSEAIAFQDWWRAFTKVVADTISAYLAGVFRFCIHFPNPWIGCCMSNRELLLSSDLLVVRGPLDPFLRDEGWALEDFG